ncbi:MAG: hypothetical protein Q8P60_05170 [Pseudorhodobacter sp.]|nr:hypothetical protein [Pseudorhodobacter sp.]
MLSATPLAAAATGIAAPDGETLARQLQEFEADVSKPITHLQPFRAEQSVTGADGLELRLTNLNPQINTWFLLEVKRPGRRNSDFYHLENLAPQKWQLSLTDKDRPTLRLSAGVERHSCDLWSGDVSPLDAARQTGLPYAPVCAARLFLRNRVAGSRTNRESTSEFLRDNVWLGDSLVEFIKGAFYQDAFLESGRVVGNGAQGDAVLSPGAAQLTDRPVVSTALGFELVGTPPGGLAMGDWYAVKDAPGIYASTMQPGRIDPEILNRPGETNALDYVERRADAYLVAFDLSQFDVGYELGTDHPGLGWSSRPWGAGRNWNIPGPDGVSSPAPLVMTGMLSPALTRRVGATFTGGFKRDHGAFRYGDYATSRYGHHYGFVVQGVVLSKLQPDLATFYVLDNGTIGMKTWTEADAELLPRIRFARQNGVALIAPDPETGKGVPGPLVRNWGPGNWSGSAKAELRSLRAGACMKTIAGKQFLIYGYFSTATPSAMARSFQAYACDYAMLLDMNAVEHTYMALYTPAKVGAGIAAQHLVKSMAEIDQRERDGTRIPRFVGFSDNRDFFYLLRKEPAR